MVAQLALAAGVGDNAMLGVQQHDPAGAAFLVAEPDAVDHVAGLRRPVEKDAQHADGVTVLLAAVTDRRGIGGHRGVVQRRVAGDIGDRELVTAGGAHGLLKPGAARYVQAHRAGVAIRPAVGDHPAAVVGNP